MKKVKKYFGILIMIMVLIGLTAPINTLAASKVKINKTSSTLYVGNTVNLKISGTKSKVKWSTTNKKVATVSNGKVTAKKVGTTTIKSKVGKDTYTCEVTVQNPSLDYSDLSLNVGNSYTLKLSGTKAKSWKTSNKKIVTVTSKGKIVAKKLGSTTISVKGANGKTYKCKVTVQEVHNHSYVPSITKQSTCTENGVLTYTCACGDNYTETLSPKGHNSSNWIIDSNSTCTTNGFKHTVCTICGVTLNTETINAMGHAWDNGVITKAPTCTEDGIKTYTCSVCHTTRTETIAKVDHTWDVGVITKSPTCLEEGIKTYTCSTCNTTRTETIAKIPHNFVMGAIVPPTCTKDGYTNYACSVCGTTEQRDMTPALGHNYVDVVVSPTCTEDGYTTHTCSRCNNTYTDTVTSAKGHTYGNFVETVAPVDFTTFGKANMVCPDCGEILYTDLTVVLLDLGSGNTTKVYGYYDRAEAETCFDLTLQYKIDNGFYYAEDGYEWNESKYNFSCIRVAENAYEFNDLLDITHDRLNGAPLGCGENIACNVDTSAKNINDIHYTSNEAFQSWLNSELHLDNIQQAYLRMSSAKFTAWVPDGKCWGVFWVQTFN